MEKRPLEASPRLKPLVGIEYGRFLLDVPSGMVTAYPEVKAYAESQGFRQKDEQHVTVIGERTQRLLGEAEEVDEVMELIGSMSDWPIVECGDVLVLKNVETGEDGLDIVEESIIQLVTLPGMDELYDQIRKITGLAIETPPAHVTLYTKNADRGIGVYSRAQLKELTVDRFVVSK